MNIRLRRARSAPRFVLAVVLVTLMLATGQSPASAAGGTLNLSMEAVSAHVDSGDGASFRVQWSCSGSAGNASCDQGKISVPVPTGETSSAAFPGGIPLTVTSQSALQIGGSPVPGAATIVGTAPNQTMVWTFPATVATGTSGTVSFTLRAPNSITPDATEISPVATFEAAGATTRTATATTIVDAAVSLKVAKNKSTPTDVPYVDQQVTYGIRVGYESQISDTGPATYARRMDEVCADSGTQALQNLKVVDTLPAGAQFVSANFGGVYDSAANTITWSLGSSISDTAPYTCRPFNGATAWVGQALQATVVYPDAVFDAAPDPAVKNEVKATANAWGQPGVLLSSDDETTHGLREGSSGASVNKGPGYDWAIGNPLYRTTDSGVNNLYYLTATSGKAQTGRWQAVDVLPCALTSPTSANDTDCATPAYTNIRFSADQFLPELDIEWTTNQGTTGVCTIPAGISMSDTTKRWCGGGTATTPVAGVPAGEWITKFEIDSAIPPYGGGHVNVHGRVSENIPTDNVSAVYKQLPAPNVDRSDVHPWYVTVENCTIENRIDFPDGSSYLPAQPQEAGDNAGPCGYRQVMTNPAALRPVKLMYDPSIPVAERPATPSAQTGDVLTVDLRVTRDSWQASAAVLAQASMTPTVTEYLPPSLEFLPSSLEIVGDATFKTALGTPVVDVSTVDYNGEDRTKIKVTFPNAVITPSTTLGRAAQVRFNVRVKDGMPAGQYSNAYLIEAKEAGPGIDDTYLTCPTGRMVDADLQTTTDRNVAVGCLAEARFNVLPVPGISTSKTVQGNYDADPIASPGIGRTDLGGDATYRIDVRNTGSVDIRNVVAYDLLPRIDDTDIIPGSSSPRGSEFPVKLDGPVSAPSGTVVEYSTSNNPCRGELAGTGGGATDSAPAGCTDDWATTPAGGDYSAVTGIRLDFGSRVFEAGEAEEIVVDVKAAGPNVTTAAALDGVAWNNTAVSGREASGGGAILPTEAAKVGLQLAPNLAWEKHDGDTGNLLGGSAWSLTPVLTPGAEMPAGFPLAITDCTSSPCTGPDTDPGAGKFVLTGLPWGKYTLVETAAPGDYVLNDEPIAVDLTAASVDRATFELDLGAVDNFLPPGDWTSSKSSDPVSGSAVKAGQTVTYTITASNNSQYPAKGISLTDDLSDVLDDASFTSITDDDDGRATRSGDTITWNVGTLAAGESRTVVYRVKVLPDGERGDNRLGNVLAPTGTTEPECSDEGVSCTEHPVGELDDWKTVDPATGTTLRAGEVAKYTLHFENTGKAPVEVDRDDVLTKVLDDADVTTQPVASSNALTVSAIEDSRFTITGTLQPGEKVTVTYAVTVKPDGKRGDDRLDNFLVPNGEEPPTGPCVPADGERPDCTYNHVSDVGVVKSSDPKSGSEVDPGDEVTYTLTFTNRSANPDADAATIDYTDHMDDVLDDAKLTGGPTVSDDDLTAVIEGDTIRIKGSVPTGKSYTVSYTVEVKAYAKQGDHKLDNVVAITGDKPVCVPDSLLCTEHKVPAPPAAGTPSESGGFLPNTGAEITTAGLLAALLLLSAGGAFVMVGRRRSANVGSDNIQTATWID